ncbi:adenosylmethionine--8-amino-7-oxononanoate aminotransferase BioA, partial [Myroides ceti]|nr:adenosylmethionine--8-amino-7-oxononanoate aminotransferase BioA [Paenimyroides ceti]
KSLPDLGEQEIYLLPKLSEETRYYVFFKGLTGGTMPMGLLLPPMKFSKLFLSDDKTKPLFHGHSFTANPLACTAALASMELLLKEDTLTHIKLIYEKHLNFSKTLQQHPKLKM